MDEGLGLLESFFQAIPSSTFVQKFDFVVKGGKPIWEPQEVTTELGTVLDLTTKMFHISSTGKESISLTLHNLTSPTYVTAGGKKSNW